MIVIPSREDGEESGRVGREDFAIVTIDEIWSCAGQPRLLERRLHHGRARSSGNQIEAEDHCHDRLLATCEAAAAKARAALAGVAGARVRLVVSADHSGRIEVSLSLSRGRFSVISAPQHVRADYARLIQGTHPPEATVDYRGLPLVWLGGSGAVLLHEAVGHAAEHGHQRLTWPAWLSVRDEPEHEESADLLAGQPPASSRRQRFSDVPLRRMAKVVVRQQSAPFDLPPRRIEIDLIGAGHYEPLSETVLLQVLSAALVDGDARKRLAPFTIAESRQRVAAALVGASGDPERDPGVICSREGQELVVGSHAPVVMTRFR